MEQLDELIFNAIESLINNNKQPNDYTIYATISKDLTSVTMEQLKEQLAVLLGKQKLLNKPRSGKNSCFKMRKNDNLSPQTPLPPTQLPITPTINNNQDINIETNILAKRKGFVKIHTLNILLAQNLKTLMKKMESRGH